MINILKYCTLLVFCYSTFSSLELEAGDTQTDSLIKHCLTKLEPFYPKTVTYLKDNQLDFIALRLYYIYLSSIDSKNSKLIDKQLMEIEKSPTLRKSIDELQMEQLWKLIPIYSNENAICTKKSKKVSEYTIPISLIATNINNNAYTVCDFLLKKIPTINDENLKRRLLYITLLRNMNVKKEYFNDKKMKYFNKIIAKNLNSLYKSIKASERKTFILIYALMEGLDIDKNLIIESYKKQDERTKKALRASIREVPPDSNKKIILKTDEEFINWIKNYKIGTRLTLPIGE